MIFHNVKWSFFIYDDLLLKTCSVTHPPHTAIEHQTSPHPPDHQKYR